MTALCSGKICTIFPEKGALNFWKACTIALEYSERKEGRYEPKFTFYDLLLLLSSVLLLVVCILVAYFFWQNQRQTVGSVRLAGRGISADRFAAASGSGKLEAELFR